ncbi:DnaJ domain-containing protein [Nocardioides sp.]|uniref:J domain-containing protein n=1 Tax=Nocardioides sp. TaxID=35761 RepID=UPI001A2E6F02|nr:DnaJ domain-containing protein [Nocardioides sp.]MBJ7358320.1 DnaJ domain-containing protein [Nocardioides sp.]
MTAPSPSWYDVLGVDQDASADDIRAAWKSGIADLDPTHRRFRLLNQAAEVLLDPEQREAYDQALTSEASAASEDVEPAVVEEVAQRPSRDQVTDAGTEPRTAPRGKRVVPAWLLAGLALAIAIFVGLSIWQATQNDDPGSGAASSDLTSSDARDAQVAAEKAAVAILAYDYRDLEGSHDAAVPYMTEDYREKYEQLFEVIEQNSPNTKTIVRAELVASAVGLVGEDRIQVLVFVNRPTLNADLTEPEISKDQATLTMVEVDGEWLVDDMTTTLPES